jgi:catechol 2,3-dioxygenase-like lactoylglutathione lyase family enzyme
VAIIEFFHLIHIVDDEDEVDAWYDAVFAPQRFADKSWLDVEKRWASLSMIGDFMIEVIEPSGEPDDQGMPLSKFRGRFGQHYHSLAWYTDAGGVKPLFERLRGMGVRIAKPGGGMWPEGDVDPGVTIFTHPKDTFGQLEFADVSHHWIDTDPRFLPGWSPTRHRDEHPLGIHRASHLTTIVTDLDRASTFYVDGLDAQVLHKSSGPDRESVFVFVGADTVVELAKPTGGPSRIADDLAANGELPHACTFTVTDLEAVERHVGKVGVRVAERAGDTLVLDPADCFGAVYAFTTSTVPGDPRVDRS